MLVGFAGVDRIVCEELGAAVEDLRVPEVDGVLAGSSTPSNTYWEAEARVLCSVELGDEEFARVAREERRVGDMSGAWVGAVCIEIEGGAAAVWEVLYPS